MNSTNIASVTRIAVSDVTLDGATVVDYISTWDNYGSAANRGTLIIKSNTNNDSTYAIFTVTDTHTNYNTWRRLEVDYVEGTLPSNNEEVVLQFIPIGTATKGQKGESNKGEKGQKGQKGEGIKGNKGEESEKGQKGDGNKGQKGEPGQKGATGESTKGEPGEATKGEPGTGQKGQKGQKGQTGTGNKGNTGQKGASGSKGQKGATGAKGQKGQKGATGTFSGTSTGNIIISNQGPWLKLHDTNNNHRPGWIHVNQNNFYVLNGADNGGVNAGWQYQVSYNKWPVVISLANNNISTGGAVSVHGNITAFASDRRLKENVRVIDSPLSKIMKINGYYFDWNEKSREFGLKPRFEKNDVGLLAQEVQEIIPQVVAPAPFDQEMDKITGEGSSISGDDYLTIQYERIVPLLLEAIKELKREVDDLRSELRDRS